MGPKGRLAAAHHEREARADVLLLVRRLRIPLRGTAAADPMDRSSFLRRNQPEEEPTIFLVDDRAEFSSTVRLSAESPAGP